MDQDDNLALEAVREDLTRGLQPAMLRSARRKIDAVRSKEVRPLVDALDALVAMEEAAPAEAIALAQKAETAARTYFNGGPIRPAALTAMTVGAAMCAERHAMMGASAKAMASLRDANVFQRALMRGMVSGLPAFEEHVRKTAKKARPAPKTAPRPGKPRPRAKAVLAKARSFRRGTLDARDLAAMAKLVKRPDLREMAQAMEDYDGDAVLVEGDLHVDGDFRTSDAGVIWLVVKGDLLVDGLYEDTSNDGPDHVYVGGSLKAGDIVTAGALDVAGDLVAKGVIVGDYNDGSARVGGDVVTRLFAPFDHAFRVGGKVRAETTLVLPKVFDRSGGQKTWEELPLADLITQDELIPRLRKRQPILG